MLRVLLLTGIIASVSPLFGQMSSPSAVPSLEQRVADLEAYVTNSPRGVDTGSASNSNIATPGPSYNAWMMTCAALVLFMTLPGLALFYGGLVRAKNVLSVLAQCLGIAGLVTILWWALGYSLVFSRGSPFIGGLRFAFLQGVDARPNSDYSYWVSQDVFAMYQLMFAIITPALIHRRRGRTSEICGRARFCSRMDVCRLFPDRTYGVGNRRLDEWRLECEVKNHGNRFCRRNRCSHELGLVGARVVHSPWAPARIQERNHGSPQHGPLYGRNGSALGR